MFAQKVRRGGLSAVLETHLPTKQIPARRCKARFALVGCDSVWKAEWSRQSRYSRCAESPVWRPYNRNNRQTLPIAPENTTYWGEIPLRR